MIEVSSENLTIDESIVEADKNALQKAYLNLTVDIKAQIGQNLSSALNGWQTPATVLSAFPFFKDKARLVVDYLDCLDILDDGEGNISLAMNTQTLKTKKLPGNLHHLLEYGSAEIPPLPHIRPVLFNMKQQISKTLEGVGK